MNISKLYQRAHALRMADKKIGGDAVPEFYVGAALGECITDFHNFDKGGVLVPREKHIRFVVVVLRAFAYEPESLNRMLVRFLAWPKDDMAALWAALLRTYGTKPRLLLAIADGMEA